MRSDKILHFKKNMCSTLMMVGNEISKEYKINSKSFLYYINK